jgi:hypothetical protein
MAVYSQPNQSKFSQNSTILEIAKFLQGLHMVQTPKTFRAANLKVLWAQVSTGPKYVDPPLEPGQPKTRLIIIKVLKSDALKK